MKNTADVNLSSAMSVCSPVSIIVFVLTLRFAFALCKLFGFNLTTKGLIKTATYTREFYGTEVSVTPRESLLILFPVWMLHMVTPLTKKSKRYSISFAINKTT